MKHAWCIIAALVVLLLSASAHAQEQCPKQIYTDAGQLPDFNCPGPGEDELLPRLDLKTSIDLKMEQQAPWAGILMDKNRVLKLGFRIKAIRRLRWEELQYCGELAAAEVDYAEQSARAEIQLIASQRENYKAQTEVLQEAITRHGKWYRSPAIWFTAGFVVAAAGAVVVAVALRNQS